jgi:uncharacterized repeat protein (TIGR01451 family)
MKKRLGLIFALALLSNLLVLPQTHASHINSFTFFIPYTANDLKTQFETGRADIDATEIVTTISISVLRDGTTVYYDHWEDGLERNLTDPIQPSTEVFTANAGDVITLQNDVPVPRPDPPTDFLYDGGDKVSAVGGSIAVSLAVWPQPLPSGGSGYLYAGAWELYPTSRWCENYVIPVGVDLAAQRAGFTVTGFSVQAVEDDTDVQILDRNGALLDSRTLAEGENFSILSGIESGTRVQASDLVQVQLFTGDPSQTYEARAFTLLCRDEWSNEYLAPRSSDGDFWLYNDSDSALSVDVETAAGVQPPITIPANSAARYPTTGSVLADRSGVSFTSTDGRPFYGLVALDADSAQDWGYALLPTSSLTTQALVGWAPGNSADPPGSYEDPGGDPAVTEAGRRASRVYVTAATATTLYVDFDGDGSRVRSFELSALEELDIVDEYPPDPPDYDMTRAFLYTEDGVPFIAVWGQDADAPPADPSIDVGTNIAPLRAPALQKIYLTETQGFNCGTLSQSHVFRFDLTAYNDSALDIVDAVVQDNLPGEFRYVPNSTTLDGTSVPDNSSGSPFPLDGDGLNIGTLGAMESATVSFLAESDATGEFINLGLLSPSADPAAVEVPVPNLPAGYQVTKTLVDPPSGLADPGQVVTFSVTISNTGDVAITELPLLDQFDPDVLTYSSASEPPTSVDDATGVIAWDDLVASLGELTPTTPPWTITLSFVVVDGLPSDVTSTINRAFSTGAQGSDGSPQAIMCAEAQVSFNVPTPTPTPTLTPTPDDGDGNGDGDDGDEEDPTPTPTPQVPQTMQTPQTTTVATPAPPSAPTPAVLLLPETGIGYSKTAPMWPLLLLPGLGLLIGWVVYRRRDK